MSRQSASAGATAFRWQCFGSSVTGVSHQRAGESCQDAFAFRETAGGLAVAAIADGAGSATHGGPGAQIGCQSSVSSLDAALSAGVPDSLPKWQALMTAAVTEAQETVRAEATGSGHDLRAYGATLLLAVVHPTWIVCASIGDCAAVIQDRYDQLISLCPPQRGEYANATHFFTSASAMQALTVRLVSLAPSRSHHAGNAITNVGLLTDGLLELALNVACNRPFGPFFQPLFSFAAAVPDNGTERATGELTSFLNSDRVNARSHDDKTLLLLRPL